ncbi:MAG: NAD-dependent epimerase/dehydratase family protein [Maritimibacter sp.]|nr:NAD-dependent epimerase/dehydratase family protein [Maritimibacter sp.]
MPDTVLLTGVTGFLGGHTAKALLDKGYHVRGSLRNPARATATARALEALGADVSRLDFVTLDLTDDTGWDTAAEGARYVLHTASPFVTTMPKDPAELTGPAVAGTERAMRAAHRAGAERVVLTSSTATIVYGRGPGRPDRLGPDDWTDPAEGRLTAYALSKVLAERRAWEIAEETGLALTTIQPGFICGPLPDDDPGTSGAVIARVLRGDVPMLPDLHFHIVDVRDLAEIHVAALASEEMSGKRVPAAFAGLSLYDLARNLAEDLPEHAGKIPRRRAPDWLVRILALFDGDIRANVNELGYAPEVDASRARALLSHAPRPARETMADMARDMTARGLVAA